MAFTQAELRSIEKIIGSTPSLLSAQINSLGGALTTDIEDAIRDQITLWDDNDLDADFSTLKANGANYGLEDDPNNLRHAIAGKIRLWLEITDVAYADSGIGTLQIGV